MLVFEEEGEGGGGGKGGGAKERTSNKLKPHTLFSLYKNVVFPAQAKNYYFILLLGWKYSWIILNYKL